MEEEYQTKNRVKISYQMIDEMIYFGNTKCTISEVIQYSERILHKQNISAGDIVSCIKRVKQILENMIEMMNYLQITQLTLRFLRLSDCLNIPLIEMESFYNHFNLIGNLDTNEIQLNNN